LRGWPTCSPAAACCGLAARQFRPILASTSSLPMGGAAGCTARTSTLRLCTPVYLPAIPRRVVRHSRAPPSVRCGPWVDDGANRGRPWPVNAIPGPWRRIAVPASLVRRTADRLWWWRWAVGAALSGWNPPGPRSANDGQVDCLHRAGAVRPDACRSLAGGSARQSDWPRTSSSPRRSSCVPTSDPAPTGPPSNRAAVFTATVAAASRDPGYFGRYWTVSSPAPDMSARCRSGNQSLLGSCHGPAHRERLAAVAAAAAAVRSPSVAGGRGRPRATRAVFSLARLPTGLSSRDLVDSPLGSRHPDTASAGTRAIPRRGDPGRRPRPASVQRIGRFHPSMDPLTWQLPLGWLTMPAAAVACQPV